MNQTWDAVSQAWLNLYKVQTTFNTSGNTILDEFDMFADNQWQPGTRTSLNIILERPATIISQVWNGSAWANSSKRTNSYDGKGESLGFIGATLTRVNPTGILTIMLTIRCTPKSR